MLISLNVISGSCISKLIGQKFTFFLRCHFLSTLPAFVFTSAENILLLPGLHMQRSAWQQSLIKILLREREVLKHLKKILTQM